MVSDNIQEESFNVSRPPDCGSLWVSATIFCQVIDVKAALFEIADYTLAVDQLSRTALRAVFGELTLDQSLSERETINTRM